MPNPHRSTSTSAKLVGGLLFFMGVSVMWFGASALLHGYPLTDADTSCKAICGLAMLFSFVLGPVAGQIVGGGLMLAAGLACAVLGRFVYEG